MELAGPVNVIGVGALTREEPEILLAAHSSADAEIAHEPTLQCIAFGEARPAVKEDADAFHRRLYNFVSGGGTGFCESEGAAALRIALFMTVIEIFFAAGSPVDVYPDGRAINLNNSIIRARYRDSLEHTSPISPGRG